jgi:hypothetical protein
MPKTVARKLSDGMSLPHAITASRQETPAMADDTPTVEAARRALERAIAINRRDPRAINNHVDVAIDALIAAVRAEQIQKENK